MDDGYSPWSWIIFIGLIVIETILYGFEAALHELSVTELQKRKEEGDKRAAGILHLMSRSFTYSSVVLIAAILNGLVAGAMLLRRGQLFLLHSLFGALSGGAYFFPALLSSGLPGGAGFPSGRGDLQSRGKGRGGECDGRGYHDHGQ